MSSDESVDLDALLDERTSWRDAQTAMIASIAVLVACMQHNRRRLVQIGDSCKSIDVTKDSKLLLATATISGIKLFDTTNGDLLAELTAGCGDLSKRGGVGKGHFSTSELR